jgi:hypothetical protein
VPLAGAVVADVIALLLGLLFFASQAANHMAGLWSRQGPF